MHKNIFLEKGKKKVWDERYETTKKKIINVRCHGISLMSVIVMKFPRHHRWLAFVFCCQQQTHKKIRLKSFYHRRLDSSFPSPPFFCIRREKDGKFLLSVDVAISCHARKMIGDHWKEPTRSRIKFWSFFAGKFLHESIISTLLCVGDISPLNLWLSVEEWRREKQKKLF